MMISVSELYVICRSFIFLLLSPNRNASVGAVPAGHLLRLCLHPGAAEYARKITDVLRAGIGRRLHGAIAGSNGSVRRKQSALQGVRLFGVFLVHG